MEERQKLITAASYKTADESEFGDLTYKSFTQVMVYRREIARRLLDSNDDRESKALMDCYEWCNKKIKHILGL